MEETLLRTLYNLIKPIMKGVMKNEET
jgi:hypothetical protein